MNAQSRTELQEVTVATANEAAEEYVFQWQSSFGTIIIEVRGGDIYVNGSKVERAGVSQSEN